MIRYTLRTLLLVFVALVAATTAFAENTLKVCIDHPVNGLEVKTASLGAGLCSTLSTPYDVIGVWSFWEENSSQFADEFSGHELFSCFDSNGDTVVQQRDTSGPDKGAKRKTYTPNASPPTGLVDLPDAVADTAAAGEVQWIVKNGGSGGPYNSDLADCRTLVGFPPS